MVRRRLSNALVIGEVAVSNGPRTAAVARLGISVPKKQLQRPTPLRQSALGYILSLTAPDIEAENPLARLLILRTVW